MSWIVKLGMAFTLSIAAISSATARSGGSLASLCATTKDPGLKLNYCTTLIQTSRDSVSLERGFKGRGNANMALKRFNDAIEDFSHLLEINPRIAGYFDNRLFAYREVGRYREALNDANMSVRLAPGYSFAYRSRALVFNDLGQTDQAIADYTKAISLNPQDIGLLVERGETQAKVGRLNAAIADFSRAIALDPAQVDAMRGRGLAYLANGQRDDARHDLTIVAAMRPQDADVARALGSLTPPPPAPTVAVVVASTAASAPAPDPVQAPPSNALSQEAAMAMSRTIGSLEQQIRVLTDVIKEQQELKRSATADQQPGIESTIQAIDSRVQSLQKEMSGKDTKFKAYLTSIKPNDRDLYMTARKASEIYPKIPFYIPGTNETGEFWVEPVVSDRGEIRFNFKFVDNGLSVEKVRGDIEMSLAEVEDAQKALFKLHAWSKIAHEQHLRKSYEKRVTCFPVSECPPDGEKVDGKASTEIRFNVYEDGSTAGRIQRNKGLFSEGYNVSIDGAMLLQAYLAHVSREAKREFNQGTQTKQSLDKIFQ